MSTSFFSARDLNAYLEQIAQEIETKAEKYRGKDLGYLLGLRDAAQIVSDRMIDMAMTSVRRPS